MVVLPNVIVYTATVERDSSQFGQDSGRILRRVWYCEGSEENLLDCPTGERDNICDDDRDVGVYCFGKMTVNDCLMTSVHGQ